MLIEAIFCGNEVLVPFPVLRKCFNLSKKIQGALKVHNSCTSIFTSINHWNIQTSSRIKAWHYLYQVAIGVLCKHCLLNAPLQQWPDWIWNNSTEFIEFTCNSWLLMVGSKMWDPRLEKEGLRDAIDAEGVAAQPANWSLPKRWLADRWVCELKDKQPTQRVRKKLAAGNAFLTSNASCGSKHLPSRERRMHDHYLHE